MRPALIYCPEGEGATLTQLALATTKSAVPGAIAVAQYLEFLIDARGQDWKPGFELQPRPMIASDLTRLLEIGK